jgi:hypothetical protein
MLPFLLALSLQAKSKIFLCLEKNPVKISCLEEHINNNSWISLSNSENSEFLATLVERKDFKALDFVLRKKLAKSENYAFNVLEEDLHCVFKHMLNVSEKVYMPLKREAPFTNLTTVEQLILAENTDKSELVKTKNEENITKLELIARTVHIFGDAIEIAQALAHLTEAKKLDIKELELYLQYFEYLFIYDTNLTRENIEEIVRLFLPFKLYREIFLIVNNAVNKLNYEMQVIAYNPLAIRKIDLKDDDKAELMAFALMEWSRINFSRQGLKDFLEYKPPKETEINITKISKSNKEADNLSKFIVRSILYPKAVLESARNYVFWKKVFEICLSYNDYHSAFTVGLALMSYDVENLLKNKYKSIILNSVILNPYRNFYKYREIIEELQYYIPFFGLELKDITYNSELNLFYNGEINFTKLAYYENFAKRMLPAINKYKYITFKTQEKYGLIFDRILYFKDGDIISNEGQDIYNSLWPERAINKKVNEKFRRYSISTVNLLEPPEYVNNKRSSLMFKTDDNMQNFISEIRHAQSKRNSPRKETGEEKK